MESNWKRSTWMAAVLGLALLSGCMSDDAAQREVAKRDKAFVKEAAKDGLKEVEMGRLGVSRAQSPEVRQLAQRIVTDHSQANQELMTIAQRNGIETPTSMREGRKFAHMESMTGSNFDRMFVQHMMDDHQKDIQKFETAARNAADPEIRSFAARTLPILQEHLRMTENIAAARGYSQGKRMMSEPAGSRR